MQSDRRGSRTAPTLRGVPANVARWRTVCRYTGCDGGGDEAWIRRMFEMRFRARFALSLAVGLVAAAVPVRTRGEKARAASLLKGPYLTGLSETGIDVRFELAAPASAHVEVRPDGADAAVAASID